MGNDGKWVWKVDQFKRKFIQVYLNKEGKLNINVSQNHTMVLGIRSCKVLKLN